MYSDILFKLLHIMTTAQIAVGPFRVHLNLSTRLFCNPVKFQRKFFSTTLIYVSWAIFVWGKTIQLWLYHGGESNPHFHASYGLSCITFFILWMLATYYVHNDDLILGLNRILHYFPHFISMYNTRITFKMFVLI